jgi:Flp pilus assembly protein TadD
MSLLLDALKKSGEKQQGTGLSGLTLEEAAPARAAPASSASASNRAAGENMFAAKKKRSAGFTWNLGLVPTTLLFAVIFGSGYGYYVWLEIQPPKIAVRHAAPPPPPTPVAKAPAMVPLVPTLRATPAPAPAPAPVAATPFVRAPVATARQETFTQPRPAPSAKTHHKRTRSNVVVRSRVKKDAITPLLLGAYQAYQRGDYVTATQNYRHVLSRDEHNRDALLGLAAIAQQMGQGDTAQNYYRELLQLDPRDPVAQAALANNLADRGDTESHLKSLLAEQPRSGALNFALGNYYADQSDWSDAQSAYFNAHSLDPANAQYAFNLAVSLDHLGQQKLAAQFYQQALQLDVSGHSGFDRTLAQQRLNELTHAR